MISIKSGQAGVLYKRFFGGTVVDKVYYEGIKLIFPWDIMYIYNIRIQEIADEFDVLTTDGLKIRLYISIRYYPDARLLGVLHQKVGQNYVNTIVVPEIENVLRVLIGRLNAEEVYTTKRAIIEKSLNEAIEKISRRYVIVDNVIIKKMELPAKIERAIQDKIEQKHMADSYKYIIEQEQQEIERKNLEATGLMKFDNALSDRVLQWMAIQATLEVAKSENAKVVIIGNGKNGLPIIGNLPLEGFDDTSNQFLKPNKTEPSKTQPSKTQSPDNNKTNAETQQSEK